MMETNRQIKNKEIIKDGARYRENPQRSSRIREKIRKELKQREEGQGNHTDITHREDGDTTPSVDLEIEIESETLSLFSEEEEQEVQEIKREDRVGNDRWDLLAYHSSGDYTVQFGDLSISCPYNLWHQHPIQHQQETTQKNPLVTNQQIRANGNRRLQIGQRQTLGRAQCTHSRAYNIARTTTH